MAALDVRSEHDSVSVGRRVTVHCNRAVFQTSRVGTVDAHAVLVPLVGSGLVLNIGRENNLAAVADHRAVQRQLDFGSRDHIDRIVSRHFAAGSRLHDIHLVVVHTVFRIHRQRAARGTVNRRPCRTLQLGPTVHNVISIVVAKVRREGHLAACAQRVNRGGHFNQNRVVHIHIVRSAFNAAARARHLRRHCVYIGLVGCSAGYHDHGVVRLDDAALALGQVAVVQLPCVVQNIHVVVNVVDVRVQCHRVVLLCAAQNSVAAHRQSRLRDHPHRVGLHLGLARGARLAHLHTVDEHHRVGGAAHVRRVVEQHAVACALDLNAVDVPCVSVRLAGNTLAGDRRGCQAHLVAAAHRVVVGHNRHFGSLLHRELQRVV